MEILLVIVPILALVGYLIGKSKGRAGDGAVLGAVLGPIGWLITACGKSKGMRKCPFCAEEVKAEATVCRFCARELPILPPQPPQLAEQVPGPTIKQGLILTGIVAAIVGIVTTFAVMADNDGKPKAGKPNKDGLYVDAQGHWHGLKQDTAAPEIRRARPVTHTGQ